MAEIDFLSDSSIMLEKIQSLCRKSRELIEKKKNDVFKQTNFSIDKSTGLIHTVDVLNRGTIKLCEIDKRYGLFSDRKNLRFIDVCSAPGGFIDYILLRKKYSSEGYGISLPVAKKGLKYDIKRTAYNSVYLCYYDILDLFNSKCKSHVFFRKIPKADLVLADGADVNARIQNTTNLRNVISAEILIIKRCCKKNGNALLKLFDITDNEESIDQLVDLIEHFKDFYFFKPPHSRPTNAERYLILKGYSYKKRPLNCLMLKKLFYAIDAYFNIVQFMAFHTSHQAYDEQIASTSYANYLDLPLRSVCSYN